MQSFCPSLPPPSLPAISPFPTLAQPDPKPSSEVPLWTLLARLLPPKVAGAEFYTPAELGTLVGLGTPAVQHHCRDLFPNIEGQYRLNRKQAELVLIRLCAVGRKLPSRESLEERLRGTM